MMIKMIVMIMVIVMINDHHEHADENGDRWSPQRIQREEENDAELPIPN